MMSGKKNVLVLAAILLAIGCSNPESEVFHDDYYYSDRDVKFQLQPSSDEYYLVVKTAMVESAVAELQSKGFEITEGPAGCEFYHELFAVPEELTGCYSICVKGACALERVNVDFIYSNCLYYGENGILCGKSNQFYVRYDPSDEAGQLKRIETYANQHHVHPLAVFSDLAVIILACTDDSAGNPVEMANWFVETAGFPMAQPEYSSVSLD